MARIEMQYRTFDQLLDEVRGDLHVYEMEGMIEPSQLIKVAQRVNYDLGLKLHSVKERVLEVSGGRVRLPSDFYQLQSAYICSQAKVHQEIISGRHTEDIKVCIRCGETRCGCEYVTTTDCGDYVTLVHKKKFVTYEYEKFTKLGIVPAREVDPICSRNYSSAPYQAQIKSGHLYISGIDHATVYIAYLGQMEDEEGNLLVIDQPVLNEYYEYALKQRILENLYLNGEDVTQKMQLIEQRLRPARTNALTLVNTPDFREMHNIWWGNRRAMYSKYYHPFIS